MILKDTLRQIVQKQKEEISSLDLGVSREMLDEIGTTLTYATILSGIRRCGKSTLLRQMMAKIKKFNYFNFEDSRALSFEAGDFEKLDTVFREENNENDYYFFDEIQNAEKWEYFVRELLDKNKKVVITGSNASLLSKELGTKLTGRHLSYELFPFSYNEMLEFVNKKPSINSFEEYLQKGGFPQFLKYENTAILQELISDIISRDIIVRHKLRDSKTIKEMAIYLLSNVGKEFSYNGLRKMFELGSTNTAVAFVSYFEDSYIMFTVPKFSYSIKKQIVSQKKIYSIDTGLAKANSVSLSSDNGRILENVVFLNLRRKYKEIFYFKEKSECDFVVREKSQISQAIQVCYNLDEDNKKREIGGLIEAMEKFKLSNALILTYNQEDEFRIEGKKIIAKPVWKWMSE